MTYEDVTPAIFREYDIRGIVDKDLTEEVVRDIGRAYGTTIYKNGLKDVTVGRDGRLSSERFQKALTEGILETGCNVTDVGLCPTPLLYFSIFHLQKDGGVQVTGSHNPPEFNGLKICVGKETIHGEAIQGLKKIIEARAFTSGAGSLSSFPIIPAYQHYIKQNISLKRPLKVVIDAGNGTGGLVAPDLFRHSGCEVTELYCEVDGRFPNHFPDPTIPEHLGDLIRLVTAKKADFGIGYDGDADRLGVVDEKGNILFGDQLLILFARQILKTNPGATVIGEVKCSQTLYNDIAQNGGRPIMWKAGHSLIKSKLREEKALLAGEMSGHIFFADRYFGFDDAIYGSLRLAEIVAQAERPLSELLSDVPKTFSTPEIRVPCPDESKFAVVEKVKEYFQAHYKTIDIDGVRIVFDDGWGLIRASNTQPVLVLRFEALSAERLDEIRNLVEGKLRELAGY
ncbi:MAG: phosphomannomutase/phosphoglucomutase [Thermodesulfobacteriota bacterium]